jgi:hypothetical protein
VIGGQVLSVTDGWRARPEIIFQDSPRVRAACSVRSRSMPAAGSLFGVQTKWT